MNSNQQSNNRRVIFWIAGIPILVFVLSSGLYYLAQSRAIDMGTVNHGELITPPLQFAELPLTTIDGEDFDYSKPEQKWAFVVVGDSRCTGDCERMLYIARQSIIALAKKMDRVRLVYLTPGGVIDPALQQRFDKEYHGIDVITVADDELQNLFDGAAVQPHRPRTFFVVDPHGWLMMSYQADNTEQDTLNTLGKAVLKDMKRLIK